MKTLIQALVLSRLDYCNSILVNLPDVTLAPLVLIQHSAARLIRNLKRQDPVLPLMMELHWLPLRFRITFKICVLMHGVYYGTWPKYMKEYYWSHLTRPCPVVSALRSAAMMNYDIERTSSNSLKGHLPSLYWSNSLEDLPANLICIGNILSFKRNLKTHLFSIAYICKQ